MKKIAVIGGGCGSMGAVYALTSEPGWQERYEITVYQLGWRLGGKGASGRSAAHHQRIEEHGIHMWNGFYDEAFAMMRQVYEELGRDPRAPLATFERAFVGRDRTVYHETVGTRHARWYLEFPENAKKPGDRSDPLSLWDYVREMIAWLVRLVPEIDQNLLCDLAEWLCGCADEKRLERPAFVGVPPGASVPRFDKTRLHRAYDHARAVTAPARADWERLLAELEAFGAHAFALSREHRSPEPQAERFDHVRRLVYFVEIALAVLRGVIGDGVIWDGYNCIDDQDFCDWLVKHGCSEEAARSAPVRALYDAMFAYENGDATKPRISAGATLHGALRLFLGYRGHLYYQMMAGMGDVVFAPLYEVLRHRGVRFEFFCNVLELTTLGGGLSDGVQAIKVGRQARTLNGAPYAPLRNVGELPTWPSEPLWEQLADADALRGRSFELPGCESVETFTLRRGHDFDLVVLGVPPAAHPAMCAELIASNPAWGSMVDGLGAVATVGTQIWLTRPLSSLAHLNTPTVGAGYRAPLSIWANASHLTPREGWEATTPPRATVYLTGVLACDPATLPVTDADGQARANAEARARATTWLASQTWLVLPNGTSPTDQRSLDWDLLYDAEGRAGQARCEWQYWRANVSPSELYVQSLPGTNSLRLAADGSGFVNLYLAGDWIDTGYNMGFVEAAVIGGLRCAEAVRKHVRASEGPTDAP